MSASVQGRIDALVARASTEEPTEEARTSAWIAIKVMRQHGGAISLPRETPRAPPPPSGPPGAWSPMWSDERVRAAEAAWATWRASPPPPKRPERTFVRCAALGVECWWCERRIQIGEEFATHPDFAPLCGDCHAQGH